MHYRAYLMEKGQTYAAIDLACVDDDEAKQQSANLSNGRDVEVWQGDRRVGLLRSRKEDFGLFGVSRQGLIDRTIARVMGQPRCYPWKEAGRVKTTIIALSAVALIAAAPAVLAQNVSSQTPGQQHHAAKKHPRMVSGYAPRHAMHAKGLKTGNPGAFGYAPSEPKDYTYENSRSGM